jgi:hypothetical protein
MAVAIALSGCAAVRSIGAEKGETVYAASADVIVRATPFATSKGIGRLSLHEPVTRLKVERGFAQIAAKKGGLEGWVDASQLISQLPGSDTPARTLGTKP